MRFRPQGSGSLIACLGLVTVFMTLPAAALDSDVPTPGAEATLLFTGDVLPHTPVTRSAARYGRASGTTHDFAPIFSEVAPAIAAVDWAVCHLEVAIGVPGVVSSPFPLIAAPAAVALGLAAAGFDACSTASNHSLDFGVVGVHSTIAALDHVGLAHTGTAMDSGTVNGILYVVDGLVVGHASYSYGFNGFSVPGEQPWLANVIDPNRILIDAARLRRVGAEFVVVSLHWGAEYNSSPIAFQTELAERLASSDDIDLIVGHHAHVVQPLLWISGKPVAFGLGNFLSNQTDAKTQDGVMLMVRVVENDGIWALDEMVAVPTWVDRRNGHMIRSASGSSLPVLSASAGRTADTLGVMGATLQVLSVDQARSWALAPEIAARLSSICARGGC
ncbi:MAG TPA: CapA family protein [Acidimicrobiia bacterium]|nr:CapA family protein [Acidimicrobiia bacterium]